MTINYVSTRGGVAPVGFDEAVLQGFAEDGGLFVPDAIPRVSGKQLSDWAQLSYPDLAFEVISRFVGDSVIPSGDLRRIVEDSFRSFEHPGVIDVVPLGDRKDMFVMELFHGPTLSFKDVAMGFLINVMDYLLQKTDKRLYIVLATTGDTGPAAAWAAAGKKAIDCWPLYPRGMISEQQERQMTTLNASNVHPVGVENCPDGGDDLDLVVAQLFADQALKRRLNLSSVNSINWCRVMAQSVHYFYGYFRVVEKPGDKAAFSVPSGAFGNLFGGYLARTMGLPVETFVCANNVNQALHTAISTGVLEKKDLVQTMSSAIDIVVPYNFWRLLYFTGGCDAEALRSMMDRFNQSGKADVDKKALSAIQEMIVSISVSDEETAETMRRVFACDSSYLLDPHTAVAVAAAGQVMDSLPEGCKMVCLATAHPAKFPEIVRDALNVGDQLPEQAKHHSIERAARVCQHLRLCNLESLSFALADAMEHESTE